MIYPLGLANIKQREFFFVCLLFCSWLIAWFTLAYKDKQKAKQRNAVKPANIEKFSLFCIYKSQRINHAFFSYRSCVYAYAYIASVKLMSLNGSALEWTTEVTFGIILPVRAYFAN